MNPQAEVLFTLSSLGFILVARSSFTNYKLAEENIPQAVNYESPTHESIRKRRKTGYNQKAIIPRNDSEFSLGLSRNESVNRELNEIGPLCETGQTALLILQFSGLTLLGTAGILAAFMTRSNK